MRSLIAFGFAAMLATSAHAAVNLVTNGSFETGTDPAGTTLLATGSTALTGWQVLAEGVNYVDSSVWSAADGSRSIELATTNGNGGILQGVGGFTKGYRYRLTFDLSANPFDPATRPKPSRVLASVTGGTPQIVTYNLLVANLPTNMNYATYTYDFIAGGANQNLQFRSLVGTQYGPVIDNVGISVVPEASTWIMLLAGFGLVGAASRRRSRRAVAA